MKGVVFFDLDGTLIDTMGPKARIFSELSHEFFGAPRKKSLELCMSTAGAPLEAQMGMVCKRMGKSCAGLKAACAKFHRLEREISPRPFPGAKKALEALRKGGYKIALSTSANPGLAKKHLGLSGLLPFFDLVLGTSKPSQGKGEYHFSKAAKKFKLAKSQLRKQSLFVGDGMYDMEVAEKLGIPGVGIPTTFSRKQLLEAGACAVPPSISGVPAVVRRLLP